MIVDDLERHLGDARGDGPGAWRAAVDADEAEAFPTAGFEHLKAWGYSRWLVPEALGGKLRGLDELVALGRRVARRDLTLAIAVGQSLLGALPVWIAGSPEQRQLLAGRLIDGALGCLALTEEAHGSDLAAGEVCAARVGEAWFLDGTKWCVNNATLGETLTVLARTDPEGGPRGFSVFLVEKDGASGIKPIPRLHTHGIRGADISGATFARTPATLVGREGHGLDLVLKTLQVSRTLCSAFSLGAADVALALARDFARDRRLYGAPAWDIPAVRRALDDAALDLEAAQATARTCARALSFLPGEISVLSAVAKVMVPELCARVISSCATVLGARAYLREGPAAVFQKLVRDHAVVPLFDGSTPINLYVISGQLPRLAGARAPFVPALFSAEPAPPFDGALLRTSSRGEDHLLGALDGELAERRDDEAEQARALAEARQDSPERLAAAHRYARLCAAACCLHGCPDPDPVLQRLLT